MVVELLLAPEVEQDIGEAYRWYEERRRGPGEEFLSCIDACLQRICRTPEQHAKVHEDYRRALVRRFPYAVFYEYARGTATVYSVCHTARDPQKWRSRLP
jgi:plasmid stabilization system protein ParE